MQALHSFKEKHFFAGVRSNERGCIHRLASSHVQEREVGRDQLSTNLLLKFIQFL